jgi:hypothetical protein
MVKNILEQGLEKLENLTKYNEKKPENSLSKKGRLKQVKKRKIGKSLSISLQH